MQKTVPKPVLVCQCIYSHTNLFTHGLCPQESNNNFYNQQWTILAAETWVYMPCNNRDELVASQNCRWKQLVSLQYRPLEKYFRFVNMIHLL